MNNWGAESLQFNPCLKYYLLNKRFTPVVSAGVKFDYYSKEIIVNTNKIYPTVGLGVSLMNKKGNFYVEYGMEAFMRKDGIKANLFPYLRLGFFLNRKK